MKSTFIECKRQRYPLWLLCQALGVSVSGYSRWSKQLEEENRKLKQLVADLSLDKHMLQEVIRKKL